MAYKSELQSNNTDLQSILTAINELPEAESVSDAISAHNTDEEAHSDIRALISNFSASEVYFSTIGTTWTEDTEKGTKTQTISIAECTGADDEIAKIDVYYNGDESLESYATFVEQQNQFLDFITNGYAETVAGGVKFTIFGNPNTIEIPIIVEVG